MVPAEPAMKASRQAFIGAGANLGDRVATLDAAIERLRATPQIESLESSSLYETEPVGVIDQPRFLNLVIGVATTLSPEQLLERLLAIEEEFGRVRSKRWGPRTLDLDLLTFEGECRAEAKLHLPHPRLYERAFVTVPLRELLARPRFQSWVGSELRAQLEGQKEAVTGVRLFSR